MYSSDNNFIVRYMPNPVGHNTDTGTGYLYLYLQIWRVYGAIPVPAGIDSIHYLYLQVYLQITCGLPVYLQVTCELPVYL
jgi:hypothetical protein